MRKYIFLTIIVISCLNVTCSRDEDVPEDGLSVSDFEKHLKAEMTYPEIINLFGEPDEDIGSGIHIYVYNLTDNTRVWIGYTDRILYARQVDGRGTELKRLI